MTSNPLGKFDGKEVAATTIKVTNAGDGLSEAIKVDPDVMHLGDERFVVLRTEVTKVEFKEIRDTGLLQRVHTLKATEATMVDGDLVTDHLDAQRRRIEEAKGIDPLPFADLSPEEQEAAEREQEERELAEREAEADRLLAQEEADEAAAAAALEPRPTDAGDNVRYIGDRKKDTGS